MEREKKEPIKDYMKYIFIGLIFSFFILMAIGLLFKQIKPIEIPVYGTHNMKPAPPLAEKVALQVAAPPAAPAVPTWQDDGQRGFDVGDDFIWEERHSGTFKVGETFKVGNMQYTVNYFQRTNQIGNGPKPKKPEREYLLANITVTNLGNEERTLYNGFFDLFLDNRIYASTSGTYFAMPGGTFTFKDLGPGQTLTATVPFDEDPAILSNPNLKLLLRSKTFGTYTAFVMVN